MHSKIVRRIDGESGVFSKLASELSPSDLQSLLLGVYQTRAAKLDETDIMARARQTRDFFRVSIAMHSHARKGSTQWIWRRSARLALRASWAGSIKTMS
jgi:hypothetical protein